MSYFLLISLIELVTIKRRMQSNDFAHLSGWSDDTQFGAEKRKNVVVHVQSTIVVPIRVQVEALLMIKPLSELSPEWCEQLSKTYA